MDIDLRTLARTAQTSKRRADRLRLRAAVERAGHGGTRQGLRAGDVVKIASCLVVAGVTIEHFAVVQRAKKGTDDDAPPRLAKSYDESGALLLDHWKWWQDVTGCPMCRVTLVRAGVGTIWTRPGDAK